jgi:CubicO group peptidase (beta-lactamase class C family)
MKASLIMVFAIFSCSVSSAQLIKKVNNPNVESIKKQLIDQKIPAVAIGIISEGKIVKIISEGHNDMNRAIDSKTIFDVASLTKTITTLIALKLVDSNSWDLDEPLFKYWIDPDVKDNPNHKKLTTRHVLSHRTGFLNWRWMHETKKLTFDFEPGKKFKYSGEGYEYLRKALEVKFEKSLEELSDSLVFKPLKMKRSSLIWNDNIMKKDFAGTHNKTGKPYEYEKSFKANAADNLLTTIEDFSNLAVEIINQNFLSQEIFKEMIKQQSIVREGIDFGLGWIVFNNLPNGEYALFNAGSDQGVNALTVLLPNSKRGMVVMTNGDNGRGMAMKLIAEILGDTGKQILGRF